MTTRIPKAILKEILGSSRRSGKERKKLAKCAIPNAIPDTIVRRKCEERGSKEKRMSGSE